MDFNGYSSQVLEWIEGVQKNRGIDAQTTLRLCENIKEYAKKQDDEQLLGYAYYYSGETFYTLNNVDRLFKNISCSLPYLEHSKQHGLLARAYNILAITSMNRGNAPLAMDYYLHALIYCNKYNLYETGIIININIGTLYSNFGEYAQSAHYLDRAYAILMENRDLFGYYSYLMNIYVGMANCFLHRNLLEKAQDYVFKVQQECLVHMDEIEKITFTCFSARLYHLLGKTSLRDECIGLIRSSVNEKMPILDIFDDLYEYCEMLFTIGNDEALWELLSALENMAKQAKIINMQKRLLILKIRYYKQKEKSAEYLQATGLFFELSELLEKENRYMVTSVLNMRDTLEETQATRRKIEAENQILLAQSQTDALTGLANRYRLNGYAEDAFARAREQGTALAVEILDIDYFKQYNDNYGHQAGDMCLRRISDTLREMERPGSIFAARYGGDEFIIIYEDFSKEEVTQLAEQLKKKIMGLQLEHKFSLALPIVTISQGVCWGVPQKENKAWDFLHAADTMLYKVKKRSRNSVCVGYCMEE